MRKILMMMAIVMTSWYGYAQTKNYWTKSKEPAADRKIASARIQPGINPVFDLDLKGLQQELRNAPEREKSRGQSDLIVSFPNADGTLERFKVLEASVMDPILAAKYPNIRSYAGQGIDDPTATIRFSVSDQRGFHGMVLTGSRKSFFIDPYSSDGRSYTVYNRESLTPSEETFRCLTEQFAKPSTSSSATAGRTNDKKMRKYRLALSCTAEYGNIFAGTGTDAQKKANILAQMNITMTRVNGVYEKDLAITMQLVANNDLIIYFGSTTADPWSNEWNTKTQQVNDGTIGSANYDIGHNFNTTGGGNAGCIACVCVAGSKGSGYTGRTDPTGDAFDIDYVAHEMGHQFGGYHVQSNASCISGSGTTEVEPGSGSSIMGYAGICAANVQSNSDAYFNYVNIRDISANVQTGASSGCAQVIAITNNPPTANAGLDYTIPKSTAFVLKGQGSDPDGDALTYTWEQNDPENPNTTSNAAPTSTKTVGPMFRSRQGTSSPNRYFPQISDVVANNLAPTWEVIPSVARTLNFALTVRDNKAGGGQTSDDLMKVTVNGTAGPFVISAPNTAVSWSVGSSQTVTWNVASTNVSPVSCANVNILLSTDGGFTYPVTLLSNTPNDGSQAITVPNNASTTCRVKVEAADNIFYDISNVNFTITGSVSCTATVPTGLAASGVTSSGATLNWNAVAGATFDVQYRVIGAATWTTIAASSNTTTLSSLTASTSYEAQVRSKCPTTTSAYSASVNFTTTTVSITYCASKGNSVADEYINRVQLGTINNLSGANAGYGNFTAQSTNLAAGSANTITITPSWSGTVYSEAYAVWIDYNRDGDFADAGEQVWTKAASTTTPVSGSFTVPSSTTAGSTRMRVSMKYNGIPTSCETFSYGEVEDYSVNITTGGGTCTNVTVTIVLDDYPEETSWTIKNSSGATVASGGTYGSSPDRSTVTATNCLATGCYTFVMNDSYGDGICCAYGNGSYTVKDAAGTTLASGSTFTTSASHSICVGGASKTSKGENTFVENINVHHVSPNPVKNQLNLNIPDVLEVKSITIMTVNGAVRQNINPRQREVDVTHLSSGMYILLIETKDKRLVEKFFKE
jgi:hypothetical protein